MASTSLFEKVAGVSSRSSLSNAPKTANISSKITGGWALVLGLGGLYLLAGSRLGKVAVGLTSLALLYQTVSLLDPAKQATENPSIGAAAVKSAQSG